VSTRARRKGCAVAAAVAEAEQRAKEAEARRPKQEEKLKVLSRLADSPVPPGGLSQGTSRQHSASGFG
jgi:hypothetical protein